MHLGIRLSDKQTPAEQNFQGNAEGQASSYACPSIHCEAPSFRSALSHTASSKNSFPVLDYPGEVLQAEQTLYTLNPSNLRNTHTDVQIDSRNMVLFHIWRGSKKHGLRHQRFPRWESCAEWPSYIYWCSRSRCNVVAKPFACSRVLAAETGTSNTFISIHACKLSCPHWRWGQEVNELLGMGCGLNSCHRTIQTHLCSKWSEGPGCPESSSSGLTRSLCFHGPVTLPSPICL